MKNKKDLKKIKPRPAEKLGKDFYKQTFTNQVFSDKPNENVTKSAYRAVKGSALRGIDGKPVYGKQQIYNEDGSSSFSVDKVSKDNYSKGMGKQSPLDRKDLERSSAMMLKIKNPANKIKFKTEQEEHGVNTKTKHKYKGSHVEGDSVYRYGNKEEGAGKGKTKVEKVMTFKQEGKDVKTKKIIKSKTNKKGVNKTTTKNITTVDGKRYVSKE
tara:strand:- start:77 stop:715 length:639 start_codon:yes stop_codon:yes gene_type:complete